jgi:hypothetical protein
MDIASWGHTEWHQFREGLRVILSRELLRAKAIIAIAEHYAWVAVRKYVFEPAVRRVRARYWAGKSWWRSAAARGFAKRAVCSCGCNGAGGCDGRHLVVKCRSTESGLVCCQLPDRAGWKWFGDVYAARRYAGRHGLRFVGG